MTTSHRGPWWALAALGSVYPGVWITSAHAEHGAPRLPVIDVRAAAPASTAPEAEEARERLDRVPGGTTFVDQERLRAGRAANLEDALDLVPGVYARSRFGQDEMRLSIRGSGVSRTFNTRGVRLLRDGLPMTEADGNTRTQLIDPLSAQHLEVYRGANAFGFGAATLGGAVNLISPTGYSTEPLRLRAEAGGFGYRRLQGQGAWLGETRYDGVANASLSRADGFRTHSRQEALRFYGNLGAQHGERRQTRVHLDAQDSRVRLPGSLTDAEWRADPRQAAPGHEAVDARRDITLARLAVQHAARTAGGGDLQLGGYVQDLQMDHPLPFAHLDGDQQDAGVALRHSMRTELWGRDSDFTWGLLAAAGREASTQTSNFGGAVTRRDFRASTTEVYAQHALHLTGRTQLIGGAQVAHARREVTVRTQNAPEAARSYQALNPRLGVLHALDAAVQVFANLSRSSEAPINGELVGLRGQVVDQQRADTLELGMRGRHTRLQWEAVAYHARLRDEILIFQDPDNPQISAADNAERSVHQGVELGLAQDLPLARYTRAGDTLRLAGAYTYSRFRFDGDAQWGDNVIPGIPAHTLRLELAYRTAAGFHMGPVVEYASGYYVDFANTLRAERYLIWGARAGYDSGAGWRAFLDARNLADRRYVANTSVVADARDNDRVFNPGAPRAIYGGVEWHW